MSTPPLLLHRAPLRLVTARLRLTTDPSIRFDPAPIVTYRTLVELELLRADGQPERVQFRIDTGAGITQMSLKRADTLGVRIGNRRGDLEVTTAKETAWEPVVVGSLKVRFPGGARVFLWRWARDIVPRESGRHGGRPLRDLRRSSTQVPQTNPS